MNLSLTFARLLVLALFFFLFSTAAADAQTNVFTYQGHLTQNSALANGTFNMVFDLYNLPAGGSVLDTDNRSVLVTNGIFTVELDFDAVHYTGQSLYLGITVEGTPLTPRQQIVSVPYAVRSMRAASADVLSILCVSCVTDAMVSDTLTASNLIAGSSVVSDAEVDNNLTINGGVINNTIIGGTTPAAATFTVLNVNSTQITLDADNGGAGADVNVIAEQGTDANGTLRYNSTANQWELSNNGGAFNQIGTVSAPNYAFSYSTATQSIVSSPNAFQDITFTNDGAISGWMRAGSVFTASTSGVYLIQYTAEAVPDSAMNIQARALLNGSEILGSQAGAQSTGAQFIPISKSFVAIVATGDTVRFQWTGSVSSAILSPVGSVSAGATRTSASVTITKLQ